jgi:hypothetical protein
MPGQAGLDEQCNCSGFAGLRPQGSEELLNFFGEQLRLFQRSNDHRDPVPPSLDLEEALRPSAWRRQNILREQVKPAGPRSDPSQPRAASFVQRTAHAFMKLR